MPVSATSAMTSAPSTAGRHRQPAAARHGVAGVQEQVEEHLLQLVLDAQHQQRLLRQFAADLDAADLELVLEQREDVADDGVEIDRWRVRRQACPDATASAGR